MGTPKTLLLVIALAVVLCLLLVPVLPEKDTAHARLETTTAETTTVDSTNTLLGENSPELNPPDEAPRDPSKITAGAANVSSQMRISIPRLGLKDVAVPTGSTQAELDKQGIMHLRGSGLPWTAGSNTFITGHALGFPWTRVPYAFYKLDKMQPGDEIFVEDKDGQRYTFAVYDTMTVEPGDYWVTYPVEGSTVISLQSCTPIPTFEHRLIVRGELVT